MVILNLSETYQLFWPHSVFALEKSLKSANFLDFFLPLKNPLVATFSETCGLKKIRICIRLEHSKFFRETLFIFGLFHFYFRK